MEIMRLIFRLTIFVFLDLVIEDLVDFTFNSLLDVLCLIILDSLRLLADSLERLVKLLLDFVNCRFFKLSLHTASLE